MISVGIDIGRYSVKVARIEGSSKGFKVISLDDYPLPTDPAKDHTLDILEALRDIHNRHSGEGVNFVIGADQRLVSSRRRKFAFRERHKILKVLPFELEDDIPFSIENAVFDAKLTHLENGLASVLAMACPKEHIVEQLQRVNDAGFEPHILSTEGVGIGNLFETWLESPIEVATEEEISDEKAEASLAIQIGHSKSICTLIKDGYTLDVFTIDWGGQDLAHTISIKYDMHYVEAIKELRQKAFILVNHEGVTREQVALSDVLKAEVDKLAHDLRLAIAEFESEENINISQVILCGGVASLRNLGPYLTQKIEKPVNRLARLENLHNLDFSANPNNELSHIVSIGLAAEGVKRPKNPAVNFLKGEFARQNESFQQFVKNWGPSITAAAWLFVIFFVWSLFRVGVTEDLVVEAEDRLRENAKEVMVGERRPSKRNIRQFITEQKRKMREIEVFESLAGVSSALDVLSKISGLAPSKQQGDLNITQFSVKNSSVEIIGYTDKPQMISRFQSSLKSYSSDGQVSLESSPQAPPGQRGFIVRFQVDRRGGGS